MMYGRENFKKDPLLVVEALIIVAGVAVFLFLPPSFLLVMLLEDSSGVGGLAYLLWFAYLVVTSGVVVFLLTLTTGIRKILDYPRGENPSTERTQPGADFWILLVLTICFSYYLYVSDISIWWHIRRYLF